MQTIRDAAVLLGVIVLLTSVRVAPIERLGEILPIGTAMAADTGAGAADVEADAQAVPAVQVLPERAVESKTRRSKQKAGSDTGCSSSVIHVKTLDVDGQRVILRIDTEEAAVKATSSTSRRGKAVLKPCKIG